MGRAGPQLLGMDVSLAGWMAHGSHLNINKAGHRIVIEGQRSSPQLNGSKMQACLVPGIVARCTALIRVTSHTPVLNPRTITTPLHGKRRVRAERVGMEQQVATFRDIGGKPRMLIANPSKFCTSKICHYTVS